MSTITHVRFYPSDWLAGTRGMTAAETGVYITLIAMMYERGGAIRCDDNAKLARLCGTSASAFKGILDSLIADGKIIVTDEGISNRRVELEIKNVMSKSGVARDKANARWTKNVDKSTENECSGNAGGMLANSQYPVIIDTSLRSVSSASAKPAKRKSRVATDFTPNETGMNSAIDAGMNSDDLRKQVAKFIDHHTAKGSLMLDWQAAWRTWCGNFPAFGKARAGPASAQPARRGSAALFDAMDRIYPDEPNRQAIPSSAVFQLADHRQR